MNTSRPMVRPCSRMLARWGWRASSQNGRRRRTAPGARPTGSRARTRLAKRCGARKRRIGGADATRTYLIFGDVEGALDTLRVECTKCPRKGRYSVRKLIEKYGRKANMMKWKEQLNGDCPKRDARSMHERCDLICPDLPKLL